MNGKEKNEKFSIINYCDAVDAIFHSLNLRVCLLDLSMKTAQIMSKNELKKKFLLRIPWQDYHLLSVSWAHGGKEIIMKMNEMKLSQNCMNCEL